METLVVPALLVIGILAIGYILLRDNPKSQAQLNTAPKPEVPRQGIAPASPPASDLSMLPEHFVILDLETTGLSPEKNEIIEIGAIRVHRNSDHHETFQALVKPKKKVPQFITEMTGISQAMVESEGEQLEVALADFVEFIQDLPLVTFNAQFDMGFLHSAAKRHGLVIKNRYTCALRLSRRAWPGLSSYRLQDLAKLGKLSDEDTHRALGDCKRTMIVFAAAASEVGKKVKWSVPIG